MTLRKKKIRLVAPAWVTLPAPATTPGHVCHNPACKAPCEPRYLMCSRCWYRVPKPLRDEVWRTYQAGQERGLRWPSAAWHRAADNAIRSVCPSHKGIPERTLKRLEDREQLP